MAKKKFDIYQTITDKFIASLEKGHIPWKKPYTGNNEVFNVVSKKNYRGINVMMLGMNPYSFKGYASYKQIQSLGGQVKGGEKGSMVVYWNFFEKEDKKGELTGEVIPFLKYSTVFNLEQTTGIEYKTDPVEGNEVRSIECAEEVIDNSNTPEIQYVGGIPRYMPTTDEIKVPAKEDFNSSEEMYSTIFHEMSHSVGHSSRLNRKGITETTMARGKSYAEEELIAEISASFLSHHCNFGDVIQENSEAYVQSWIRKLSDHPRMIVQCSSKAVKTVDYILGKDTSTN